LTEAAFPAGVGAEIDLSSNELFAEAILFAEDASRVVITCDSKKAGDIQEVGIKWGVRAERIGQTVPEKLNISIDGRQVVAASVSELRSTWESALSRALHAEAPEHLVPEILQKS
jgi:phosphoribosylformylglycinamidine (FGAM) synthase-like enzyme